MLCTLQNLPEYLGGILFNLLHGFNFANFFTPGKILLNDTPQVISFHLYSTVVNCVEVSFELSGFVKEYK